VTLELSFTKNLHLGTHMSVLHILTCGKSEMLLFLLMQVKCFCSYWCSKLLRESGWFCTSGEFCHIPQVHVDVNGSEFRVTCVSVFFMLNRYIYAVTHL